MGIKTYNPYTPSKMCIRDRINSTPIDSQEQFFEEAYKNADKSADNQ